MPAGNRAALPICQGARLNTKLGGGVSTPVLALLGALEPALGVLAVFNTVLTPAGQQMRHGGNGAPADARYLGAAEQNHIGLPAVSQIKVNKPLQLAPAQRLAEGVLRLLTQHRYIGVVDRAGQIHMGRLGRGGGCTALVHQQPGTRPVLQRALGGLDAGQC